MLYKLVNFHGAKVLQYTIWGNRLIWGKWKGVIPIYNDSHKMIATKQLYMHKKTNHPGNNPEWFTS